MSPFFSYRYPPNYEIRHGEENRSGPRGRDGGRGRDGNIETQRRVEDVPSLPQQMDASAEAFVPLNQRQELDIQKGNTSSESKKIAPIDKKNVEQKNGKKRINQKGKNGAKKVNDVKDKNHKVIKNEIKKPEDGNQTKDNKNAKADNSKSKKKGKKENSKMKPDRKKQGKAEKAKPSASQAIPPNTPQTTNDLNYKRGGKVTILHIAEKPSIAIAIAKGLCKGNFSSVTKLLPLHEFSDPPFPKAPHAASCEHKVTSVAGHVFNVDFHSSYQSWDSVDPAALFHAPIVRKPCKSSVVRHLFESAKNASFIVLWLDCDREGENIAFEVLECCMDQMEGSDKYDRVYRAYFSAINPSDIQKAYYALGKPDKNQSLAVDARQELDLKVGVAFSRFQTRYFQGKYADLDSAGAISYGPCQFPTLGFCTQRHVDIETFKSQPYWILDLGVYKR